MAPEKNNPEKDRTVREAILTEIEDYDGEYMPKAKLVESLIGEFSLELINGGLLQLGQRGQIVQNGNTSEYRVN